MSTPLPNRAGARNKMSRADLVSTIASVFMFSIGVFFLFSAYQRRGSSTPGEPRSLASALGDTLRHVSRLSGPGKSEEVSLVGRAHVVYVFATTCKYCQSQKEHVSTLLATLPAETVVSVSQEDPEQLAGYWKAVASPLVDPWAIRGEGLQRLGVNGVPTLLFLDREGRIVGAYEGTVFGWDAKRLRSELAKAEQATASRLESSPVQGAQ